MDGPLPGADDTTTAIYDNLRRPYGIILADPDGGGGRPLTLPALCILRRRMILRFGSLLSCDLRWQFLQLDWF